MILKRDVELYIMISCCLKPRDYFGQVGDRNTVAALAKENLLGAIFIDEAHCIHKL